MKKIIILFILSAFLFTGCSLHSAIEKFTDSPFIQKDTHNTVTAPTESPSGKESAPTIPEETQPPVRLDHQQIQSFIDEVLEKNNAVGIQVAVVDNGKIVGTYGSGWATMDTDPMTAHHKMRIASLSKIVIGLATMKMQEDGQLRIDDNIDDYWDTTVQNGYYPNTPITFRTLLTHTSSLPAHSYIDGCTFEEMLDRFSQPYRDVEPGSMEGYSYNNYGFCVLATTLEITSHKHLDEIVSEEFFRPMGIDAAFYSGDLADPGMLVTLYNEDHSISQSASFQSTIHRNPALGNNSSNYPGGLTACASDLAKIIVLLTSDGKYLDQQLLSAESIAMMEQYIPEPLSDGSYQAHPMVYVEDIYGREGIYYHPGRAFGALNCLSYDPITGDGIVVLTSGAQFQFAQYDIYTVCDEINAYIYDLIQ